MPPRPPPPNLTDQDAKVSMSWPAYQALRRRPAWTVVLGLMAGAGLLCGLCGFLQGALAH